MQAISSAVCYISFHFAYRYYIFSLRLHLVLEFVIIDLFLIYLFRNKIVKYILAFLILPFLAYNYIDYINFGNTYFGNYPTLTEFFLFIFFIIIYFYEKISIENMSPIYSTIKFWICVGLFVYFTGNFFYILLVENSKNASQEVKNQLTIIYCVVTITKNLILGLAFLNKDEVGNEGEDGSDFSNFPKDINFDSISKNHHLI